MSKTKKADSTIASEPKSRILEYSQKLSFMEQNKIPTDIDSLEKLIKEKFSTLEEYVIINHDKDTDKENNPVDPHYHIFLKFNTPYVPSFVSKVFNDTPNRVELWNKSKSKKVNGDEQIKNIWNTAISYACHLTPKAKKEGKYQYSPSDAKTSFSDYQQLLKNIVLEVKKRAQLNQDKLTLIASAEKKEKLLDLLKLEKISKQDILNYVAVSERKPAFMAHLKQVEKEMLEEKYEKFKKEMIENNQSIKTSFLYGTTATGKTKYAIEYAMKKFKTYYKSGSDRDPFAGYQGEDIIILDELRPDTFNYAELLKMLDPFNFDNVAGSRYYDKKLVAKEIIITSSQNPLIFYKKIFDSSGETTIVVDERRTPDDVFFKDNSDSPEQLFRRINVYEFTKEYVTPQLFNTENLNYEPLTTERIENKWSAELPHKTSEQSIQSAKEFFSIMLEDEKDE